MKAILSVTIITAALITALFVFEYIRPDKLTTASIMPTPAETNTGLAQKIDQLSALLAAQQASNRDKINQLLLEQTKINTLVTDLAYQLDSVENDVKHNLNFVSSNTDTKDSKANMLSEADIGSHIDEALSDKNWDMALSETIKSQAEESLSKAPGVNLDDMRCAKGVCRAKFISTTQKSPNIDELWGNPPLMNEGFTVQQEDGSLILYFTEVGTSLEAIRDDINSNNRG